VPSSPSKVTFSATGGQVYYFQVAGWRDGGGVAASGNLNFKLAPAGPANDAFANATVVASIPFAPAAQSTAQATDEAGEPLSVACPASPVPYGKAVWYRYAPAGSGPLVAETTGSSFDTVLVVWRGTSLAGLTLVGCDDDGGGGTNGRNSRVSFSATGGQVYYLQVGGWRNAAGTADSGSLTFRLNPG
jgi:hypothetical protein